MINLFRSRKALIILSSILFLSGFSSYSFSATCTWEGSSSSSASDSVNWNCDGGNRLPAAGDDVLFTNNSYTYECTWDITSNPDLGSFTMNNYSGTVTVTHDLSMIGNIDVNMGILFASGSPVITVGGDWNFFNGIDAPMGDVDGNGLVDDSDTLSILNMAMDLSLVAYCSDINLDGDTDILDVVHSVNIANYGASFVQVDDFGSTAGTIGNWTATDESYYGWLLNNTTTTSPNVGPSAGQGGSGYYIYTESSGSGWPYKYWLTSTSLDASSHDLFLSFWWNMNTDNNLECELHVEVSQDNGVNWDLPIWSRQGYSSNSGDVWVHQSVDLSSYTGTIKVRFRTVSNTSTADPTAYGWKCDTALDTIAITSYDRLCTGGKFIPGTSTVVLDGNVQTIYGSNVFYNLEKTVGTELIFDAGSRQTVLGSLKLNGSQGTQMVIRSNTPGMPWYMDSHGTRNILYTDISDLHNVNPVDIVTRNSTGETDPSNTGVQFGGNQCLE